jgi:hypothetical protein
MQITVSRRTLVALALCFATNVAGAQTGMAVEGDWVGEDDHRRVIRVTIARGRVLFLGVQDDALVDLTAGGRNRAASHVSFSADGRALSFDFAGGRFAARRDGDSLKGSLREKGRGATFLLGLI